MVSVHGGMPRAARDQHAVYRERNPEGDEQADAKAPQKRKSLSPAAIAPGTSRTKALSTSSMTAIEAVSAASAIRAALRSGTPL